MFWKRKKKKRAEALTQENFEYHLKEHKLIFAFFVAPWCGACKILKPIVHELANENKEKALIAMVNVDEETSLSEAFQIRSLPTLVVFRDRKIVYQGGGMISKPRLQEMIDSFLK